MFKDTKAFSGFSVNDMQKAKEFYVSLMVTRDGTISGPNGEMHVLAMTSNTIRMRRNGGNRR